MTDYIRMLSYIYLYDDGRKVSNVGFVKMDGRDGIVKVLVNIRLPYRNDLRKLDMVLYNRKEDEVTPVHIGELRLINGSCEFKGHIKSDDVTDCIGMLIRSIDEGENLQFASYFKDTDINVLKIKQQDTIDEHIKEPIYNNIDVKEESVETCSCGCEEPDIFERLGRQYCKCKVLGEEYECIRIRGKDILLVKCLLDDTYYIGLPK